MSSLTAFYAVAILFSPVAVGEQTRLLVDREYVNLETLVRDTPLERMDQDWLLDRVYRPHESPQKYLKLILGESDLAAKNQMMARLRQAYDLAFWFKLAKEKGWIIELTNQGKSDGHRSDLDQTGWVIAGPEANRPENFKEVQRLWEEYHRSNGIKPGQPDMTLFNGDQFLPDAKNARLGSDEFVTRMAGTVLDLRQDAEAYYVPGANKEQVHKRALEEGRTLHIAWDHESGWPVVNGKPFDLDAFRQGKVDLTYLPAHVIAARYRNTSPDAPWRYALGNLAQNLEKFLGHIDDPISRQKYGNRILDGAFARIIGVAQKDGLGGLQEYLKVHRGKADPATKRAFKEHFVRQLYGEDMSRNRVDELIRVFDTSMQIEADKLDGKPYDAKAYYAEYMSEAAANLRRREPDLKGEELRTRALDEAERIYVQKQLQAFAEGAGKVLSHAVRQDFGPEGRLVNRTEFIGSKADYEALARRQAERQVEVALLFEVVERIDDPMLRKGLRNNLIDAAGDSPELRRLFGQYAELGQAGRQAMDDWLRASAEQGKLVSPEEFYKRVGDQVEKVVGNLDEAAAKAPKEVALTRTKTAVATTLGVQQATRRQQAIEFLKTAKGMGGDFGEYYWGEFKDGLNFFFYADTVTNVIRSYQQGCLKGGLSQGDCAWRIASDTATNFFWGLPLIENYGVAVNSVLAINEGDLGSFYSLTLALAPRFGIGTSVMPIYAVYNLGAGLYEISYVFAVETLNDDLLEQALKSRPVPGKRAQRCEADGSLRADTPEFPIFGGGKNRIPIPLDDEKEWPQAKQEQLVRAQFGPAINHALLAQGLKPATPAWYEGRRRLVTKYTCELPYYQRMARLYEHLSPKLNAYVADARAKGRDLEDFSFPEMDACVNVENNNRADKRKEAAAKGQAALEAWEAEEAAKPSPISICLPRGIEAASAVLRPFMTKQVHDWLGEQPDAYRDEYSTTFERTMEGNQIVEDLRNLGHWFDRVVMGRDPALGNRDSQMKKLTDTLIREYVLGQYTYERKREYDREMARQLAGMAARTKMAERILLAMITGEMELGEKFVKTVASQGAQRYTEPPPAIQPSLRLRLPPYPVRLGRDFTLDASVRGEHGPGEATRPANAWKVEYAVTLLGDVKEGAPPDLVVTPDVAKDMQGKDRAIYTLKARVVARLRDGGGEGQVLAEDQGELTLFDIRDRPAKQTQRDEAAAQPAPVNIDDILERLRRQESESAAAAQAARERCDDAARLVRQAGTDLRDLEAELAQFTSGSRAIDDWLTKVRTAASEAARHSGAAYTALQGLGEARKRADFAAADACDGLAAVQQASGESARRQSLQGIVAAVQRCKGELQTVNRLEREAKEAAEKCRQMHLALPTPPVQASETSDARKKLQAAGARVEGRVAGVRTAQAQAREGIGQATQLWQQAGSLAEEGKQRLEGEADKARKRTLLQQMDAILRGMDRSRQSAEGCPDQVGKELAKLEQTAHAMADKITAAQADAERAEREVREARQLKDIEAACRNARSSADTAALMAASVRAMCQDGATCQAIAEDLVNQPVAVKVPGVIGLTPEAAQARLQQAGLRVGNVVMREPARQLGQEGTVQTQSPGPGQEVTRNSMVTLQVWGPPDRNTVLAATDCSFLPGSVPVWDQQTNAPTCACVGNAVLSSDGSRCIDCSELESRFAAAVNNGRLPEASSWLGQAQNCPWFGQAAAALQNAQNDQQRQQQFGLDCLRLETDILAALNGKNLPLAQSLLAQARQQNCPMDPSTADFVRRAENLQRPLPTPSPLPSPGLLPWPFPQPGPGPAPTPSGPVRQVKCNDTAKQGGNKPETLVVDLGSTFGEFRFEFDMYQVPDRMIVHYGGGTFDTGCVGSKQGAGRGKGSVALRFMGSSQVTVQVQPSCEGGSTSWKFTVHCPR